MARNTETVSVTLRPETVRALDAAAQNARRSRSQFLDLTLERALTGQGRLEALEAIAAAALEEEKKSHEPKAKALAGFAESCVDGLSRLDALQKIADGSRGKRRG